MRQVGVVGEAHLSPVYVWDQVVRITHWLIVLSILLLTTSGIYIGNPFLIVPGEAGDHFVMGTMKAIHFYSAIVFTLAVLARIWWMLAGTHWAGWKQFVPVERHRRQGLLGTLKFYLFIETVPPGYVGHNPLAGATYVLVFLLYLVMVGTGLGLYAVSASVDSPMRAFAFLAPLFGGPQTARWMHHVVMWLLLGFAVHHVASAILMSRVERNGTLDSIFSGFKFLAPELVEARLEKDRPGE